MSETPKNVDLGLTARNESGCSCCSPETAKQVATTTDEAAVTETFGAVGLTCGHCASSVTEELSELEGVQQVDVDVVAGGVSSVTVTSDRQLDAAEIGRAIEEAGYAVAVSE